MMNMVIFDNVISMVKSFRMIHGTSPYYRRGVSLKMNAIFILTHMSVVEMHSYKKIFNPQL